MIGHKENGRSLAGGGPLADWQVLAIQAAKQTLEKNYAVVM